MTGPASIAPASIARAAGATLTPPGSESRYVPGVCNIGSAEIARRRRAGHTGVIATIALPAILALLHAPTLLRLLVFFPAAFAASGYLQAWLRFCAGFGWAGVFNFGDLGRTDRVAEDRARARDRAMALRIGLGAAAIGVVAALVAAVLPV
jgi:hypothetical protein